MWLDALVFLAGLCFGSFVTMLSWRLPRGENWVGGPSHCTHCNKNLGVKDLFPVLSWLVSGGKCRGCGVKVSARYPLTELAQAALFLWIYWQFGLTPEAGILMAASVAIMVMVVVDFEHYILPDSMQIALALLAVAFAYTVGRPWAEVAGGAALGLGVGLSLCYGYQWIMKKDGLGFGDVKLLAVAGLWLNTFEFVPFLFYSGMFGVATAFIWKALGKGKIFPFGPALLLAMFLLVVEPQAYELFWHQFTRFSN
jgi:prepilin signal peptidase PulO-like enzyme (type II secretory pathway)